MKKTFSPSPAMIKAAAKVFAAMAAVQLIRPKVEKIHSHVLEKHVYTVSQEWADKWGPEEIRIRDRKRAYLMDGKAHGHYLTEVHAGYKAAGFTVDFGYCPLLIAEHEQIKAEHELLTAMEPVTGLSAEVMAAYLDERRQMLELTLKLLAPYVKKSVSNFLS